MKKIGTKCLGLMFKAEILLGIFAFESDITIWVEEYLP